MRKITVSLLIVMLVGSVSFADDFAPALLKLSADPIIKYDFDGSDINIPVTVSGKPAGVIFCVFTRNKAAEIEKTTNGYLGWHQVNKVDTCIYYSTLKNFDIGAGNIVWDGKDQDGGVVPSGEYTYYLYAYDNVTPKERMSNFIRPFRSGFTAQEVDENGLPLSNPIFYTLQYGVPYRWDIGGDPYDEALLQTSALTFTEGWTVATSMNIIMDPHDLNYTYYQVVNKDAANLSINRYKWVPDGDQEIDSDFGDDGFADIVSCVPSMESGVYAVTDYLYSIEGNHTSSNEPDVDFYIYDYDGTLIKEIDLTQWWSSPEDFDAGGQMNGGPLQNQTRHEKVFLHTHASCLNQMVDPIRYLDSDDIEDFSVWINDNGDYIGDHNWEETAVLPWVCFDYNVAPFALSVSAEDNLFSHISTAGVATASIGLFAPDGTGLGYFAFSGESGGWKEGSFYIDSETPFDGIYCDNVDAREKPFVENEFSVGTMFIAHDSINGVITSAVGVEEAAPAAFAVDQNSPNPFNPTTTISFSLAGVGNVSIEVYNVAGQKVDTIADGFMDAGSHSVVWDASAFSAGVYFYTVKSDGFSRTMKMTLLK